MKEGWKEVRLGDICTIHDSQRKTITKSKRKAGVYPYYGASGIVDYVDGYLFDGEYLLISEDGANLLDRTYPIAFTIRGKNWVNNHAHILSFDDSNLRAFVEYYINSQDLSGYISGCAQPKLNQAQMKRITLPLPPLPEQERIVAVLDSVFASIEQMKQNAKTNLINAQAVFKNALDELMEMKDGWEEVNLEDICTILDSQRKPITKSKRKAGVYPYYGASGIVDYVDGFLFDGEYLLVSEDGANLLDRTYPIAFTIRGRNWVNNHAHVLSFEDSNLRSFVEYYINSQDLTSYISGCAQPKLNQTQMRHISIPLPPLPEQQRIVSILDDLSEKCKRLERNYKRIIDDCEEMKQAVLTKAMNGEL